MSISHFEQIVDLAPPNMMIVEWGYVLRSMYLHTKIDAYRFLANVLSVIIEANPGIGRLPIHDTNVIELMFRACIK